MQWWWWGDDGGYRLRRHMERERDNTHTGKWADCNFSTQSMTMASVSMYQPSTVILSYQCPTTELPLSSHSNICSMTFIQHCWNVHAPFLQPSDNIWISFSHQFRNISTTSLHNFQTLFIQPFYTCRTTVLLLSRSCTTTSKDGVIKSCVFSNRLQNKCRQYYMQLDWCIVANHFQNKA